MSNVYGVMAGLALVAAIVTATWYHGYSQRGVEEELKNAKANQEQLDEQREIKNAVEKLDDTGLRNAINGVR